MTSPAHKSAMWPVAWVTIVLLAVAGGPSPLWPDLQAELGFSALASGVHRAIPRSSGRNAGSRRGRQPQRIVVAVDGHADGWDALEWAAAEAVTTGCALHIVHVDRWRPLLDSFGDAGGYTLVVGAATSVEILDEAEQRARLVGPGLAITKDRRLGAAVATILRRIEDGSLLVLSSHDGLRLPHNSGRTVVVSGRLGSGSEETENGGVVVASASADSVRRVLEFAFAAASRRRTGLTVVSARPAHPTDHVPVQGGRLVTTLLPDQVLERTLRAIENEFSGVTVRRLVVIGPLEDALAKYSSGAALVVYGMGTHRRIRRLLAGVPPRRLLREAASPVALVWSDRQRGWWRGFTRGSRTQQRHADQSQTR